MKLQRLSLVVSTAAIAAMLASATPAQTLVRLIPGPAANAMYGKACIRIGDQNSDGYNDFLVGAPGFNSQRGAIYCLSGAYLALGSGNSALWSVAPANNQGDLFGSALAEIADITGDGVNDFLVGQPGYDTTSANDVGSVRLVNGATHAVGGHNFGPQQGGLLGSAIDVLNATSVAVSAPGPGSGTSRVILGPTSQFTGQGGFSTFVTYSASGVIELGASIAAGPDFNADGLPDIVAGIPGFQNNAGGLQIYFPSSPNPPLTYSNALAGERFGSSVDARHDYDGDGVIDIVVGAPKWVSAGGNEDGRIVVLSGAKVVAQTPPYEIYSIVGASSLVWDFHFGAAVRACADLNNDGIGDIMAGAPNYSSTLTNLNRGYVWIFSGATGARFASIAGLNLDGLGDSITGAIQDLDGDGFKEILFAGSLSDAGGADSGVVKCFRLFPLLPATYCTGKVNSAGCTPAISYTGSPSKTPGAPFSITANNFVNQKAGLVYYSHAPTSVAFQGGLKCVAQPSVRTPQQNSGGSATGSDCTGTYSFDFGALIQSSNDASLVVGAEVFAQYWARDPQSISTTSLSNALRFTINP